MAPSFLGKEVCKGTNDIYLFLFIFWAFYIIICYCRRLVILTLSYCEEKVSPANQIKIRTKLLKENKENIEVWIFCVLSPPTPLAHWYIGSALRNVQTVIKNKNVIWKDEKSYK